MTAVDVPGDGPATDPTPDRADARLDRLSLNQVTTNRWTVAEAIHGCQRAGLPAIGLWRTPVQEVGVAAAARMVADAGLRVSSLCRGGFLTAVEAEQRKSALEENRRAIEEASALGTDCLVMVVGGLPEGSRDLAGARTQVTEGIAVLAPYAEEHGVRLALEPMHPIYCADRGVLSTLRQALDLAEQFPMEQVGVVVDSFHVWWDPDVLNQIARAAGRVCSFQVCDWITPLPPDLLMCRGMMGDGHIDFTVLRRAVDATGYRGDIEVEIFNAAVWAADPDAVVATLVRRYVTHVLGN